MSNNNKTKAFKQAALDYHKVEPKGKIAIIPTKPHSHQVLLNLV